MKSILYKGLLMGSAILLSLTSSADSLKEWQDLITQVVTEGKLLENELGNFIYLETITPNDKNADHIASYLTAMGGFNADKSFTVSHTQAVWENWQTNADGNWEVDQWMFKISNEGEITESFHYILVEKKNNHVLRHESVPTTKAELNAKWATLKAEWLSKKKVEPQPGEKQPANKSEEDKWAKLLDVIVNSPTRVPTPNGTYIIHESIIPNDLTKNRIANYISAVGEFSSENVFDIIYLDAVWEQWVKQENGDWQLDQWTFRVSVTGEYLVGRHNEVVKSEVDERRHSTTLKTDEALLKAKWNELKSGWLLTVPAGD